MSVRVSDRSSAGGDDLGRDLRRRGGVDTSAVERRAEIVHHYRGTAASKLECVSPADAAPGTGDDGDATVECGRHGARQLGGAETCGNSSSNAPRVMRWRTSAGWSSNSSCSVFCECPKVPSAWG